MNEQQYIGYCEKELTRFEARRYQFMGMEWEGRFKQGRPYKTVRDWQ